MASIITATPTLEYPQELAQARTELMLRQRRMIAEASARAQGRELPPQEELRPIVKEATKAKATAGLGSFLQRATTGRQTFRANSPLPRLTAKMNTCWTASKPPLSSNGNG